MKVLFIARATLYTTFGGDSVQVISTAEYLRKLGLTIDIKLANEEINYSEYDLLHFFNIIRPADILSHVKKSKKPYVISPVFVDYYEYDITQRKGLQGFISKLLGRDKTEYWKAIARFFKNGEKINSIQYLLWGHKKSIRKLIKGAKILLPNSNSEYNRLENAYGVKSDYEVIPYAVDTTKFYTNPSVNERNTVLCVGQIEGRKNQLNLIRALKNTDYQLVIIGKPTPNSKAYYKQCTDEAGENVIFLGFVPQEELAKYYTNAKVHVLASWFETAGMTTMEATYLGCNVVITDKGDTKEYYKDFAFYCKPNDIESIKNAVDKAYGIEYNPEVKNFILENYTWKLAAEKTYAAYQKVV